MNWTRFLGTWAACLLACGCGSGSAPKTGDGVKIPAGFDKNVKTRRLKAGDFLVNSPPYQIRAKVPTTLVSGEWSGGVTGGAEDQDWSVTIERMDGTSTAALIKHATSAENAGLDRDGCYILTRLERHRFTWGDGISYFSQFSQDTGNYPPHNGGLTYEVWAVTDDLRHVIHAKCMVRHPGLKNWGPEVDTTASEEELRAHPHYRVVQSCAPDAFAPALGEVNSLVEVVGGDLVKE